MDRPHPGSLTTGGEATSHVPGTTPESGGPGGVTAVGGRRVLALRAMLLEVLLQKSQRALF